MVDESDKYATMTNDDFVEHLIAHIDEHVQLKELLQIPGIYEILGEYYNNDVLERWSTAQHWTCPTCGAYVDDYGKFCQPSCRPDYHEPTAVHEVKI